jgi:hypothetical protein|tara:strand:+ start:44 stop:637 length:594 start_codon:yes stop_codon:yes gene_type:complete
MVEKQFKDFDQEGLEFLANNGRPIPGSSLTNSPDTPYAWEQAPQFVELQPAMDALFLELTEPEAYHSTMDLVRNGMPIGDIAQILLTDGFQKGMWNPDLLMLLVEPTMYMIIAFAEKADIQDYITYEGEDEEPADDDEQLAGIEEAINIAQDRIVPKAKAGVFPKEIEERLEKFTVPEQPSLLEKPQQSESLLGRED